MPRSYLFYLDESGQREIGSGDYFALSAVGVPLEQWHALDRQITDLKWSFFDDPDVEMKSSWFRIPREREAHYLSRYNVTDNDLTEFMDAIYDALLAHDVLIMAVVVDKRRFADRCRAGETPLSVAYTVLFERIERCLQKIDAYGLMIFDKIVDAEVKRVSYEKLLADQHKKHRDEGTEFVHVTRIVENLLFIRSSDNNGVQLADLCAYNVMRQFRDYGRSYHDRKGFLTGERYEYFARIEPKLFQMHPEGRYTKHALRRVPMMRATEWEQIGGRRGVLATDTEGHRAIPARPPSDI